MTQAHVMSLHVSYGDDAGWSELSHVRVFTYLKHLDLIATSS